MDMDNKAVLRGIGERLRALRGVAWRVARGDVRDVRTLRNAASYAERVVTFLFDATVAPAQSDRLRKWRREANRVAQLIQSLIWAADDERLRRELADIVRKWRT